MSQMTTFIGDVLELVAGFLWAEPIRYFIALAIMLVIVELLRRIFSLGSR